MNNDAVPPGQKMFSPQVDCGDACGIGGAPDRASAARSAGASSCNCPPTLTDRRGDEPIACTLDHRDMQMRADEYRAVFRRIVHAERFDHGFAWTFQWDTDVEAQVRSLALKEQECCRFFRFEVGRDGAQIVWVTRADDRAAAVLEEFFHLPERLLKETRPEHDDVKAVQAGLRRAGLVFSADAGEGRM